MRTCVFAKKRDPRWIDPELGRVTPNERDRRAKIVHGFLVSRQPAEAIVNREPRVTRACQQFQELPGECHTAARLPGSAVDNDHRGSRRAPLLYVGIQRQRDTVDVPVRDAASHSRHDVVAVGIRDDNRQALRRVYRVRNQEQETRDETRTDETAQVLEARNSE